MRIVARKVLALAFRNAIASPGANPGRAVACASGLDEDRLIDIRNDEGAGSSCECNSAIGCYMSTKNSNCVECCTPNGAYKAPAPDSSVAAPKKGGVGYLVAKRVFDIAFSAGVCLVLAVPVAVACAAICVDTPGKPFFRQERIGQGGKKIYIFKLRTMVSDAHDHPERYMSSAQLETWRREQKLDDDPRITRVGRILRRTSLDELPQFLNVLSGDFPSRILKTRQGFSLKKPGAFALPAKLARTRIAASLQVRAVICAIPGVPQNLFEYFIAGYGEKREVFAKRGSRIDFPLLGRFKPVLRNGFPI